MRRATCPTGGSPGPTSRPSWAAAAARAPGPSRRTTRTRPRSGSRRPGWPCAARPGRTPDALWFATSQPAYLDKTNATALAAALRLPGDVGRLRLRRRAALGHGRPADRARGAAGRRWSSPPTCATDCRRAATRPPAATPARRCWSATGPGVLAELVAAASRDRRVHRPLARPGRPHLEAVGGALRREPLPRARPARRWAAR